MRKIKSITNTLLGDINIIGSEKYFITITCFVAFFFLIIIGSLNLTIAPQLSIYLTSLAGSFFFAVLYYLVRFRNLVFFSKLSLTIFGLLFLDVAFYFKGFSNGPVLFFIMIYGALVIWVWEGKGLVFAVSYYFLNLIALASLEINSVESLFNYANQHIRTLDIFLNFFLYSILLILLLYIIKKDFIRQKKAVNEAKELYVELFNNTPVGLYQTTPSGKILSANKALINMLKFDSLEDLMQRDLANGSYVNFEQREEFKNRLQRNGKITDFESEWFTKNGEIIIVVENAKTILNYKGEILRYNGTVQEITEKKKIKRELISAKEKAEESDRLKSAFLANMSHEIRTPMNGILGFSELLKNSDLTIEKQHKYIDIIEKSGKRLLTTINDIIDISKIESGLVEVSISDFNISEKLNELYTFFEREANKKNIKLFLINNIKNHQELIKTDAGKLESILTNLIKNAIKYTNKGSVEIGCSIDLNKIMFYVKDTGIGVPKSRQPYIFDRFVQADIEDKEVYEGSGLGLAISKSYVDKLGGSIKFESEEYKGTTFYFSLPIEFSEENKLETKDNYKNLTKLPQNLKFKLLIVDDDEVARNYLTEVLTEFNLSLLLATNGKEALEIMKQNPDIDLILMDIKLPDINGYELTKQIRVFNQDIIIIAQTAFAFSNDRKIALEVGCNDYLSKPILKNLLIEKLNKYTSHKLVEK